MGCGAVLSVSLLADVIDIDASRTGERREGIYSAVNSLMGKLGGALAIGVSGPILAAAGFVPNIAHSDSAQLGIRILSAGFPRVGFLIGIVRRRDGMTAATRHLSSGNHQTTVLSV